MTILHLNAPSLLRVSRVSTHRPALGRLERFDGLFCDAETLDDGGERTQDGLRVPVMGAIVARNGGRICAELVDGKDGDEMVEERLADAAAGGHDGERERMERGGSRGASSTLCATLSSRTSSARCKEVRKLVLIPFTTNRGLSNPNSSLFGIYTQSEISKRFHWPLGCDPQS